MAVSYPTKMKLAFRSGNRCAFPSCDQALTVGGDSMEGSIIGEAAHIVGEKTGAARWSPVMDESTRNSQTNLIYLCANHHTLIDKEEQKYTVEQLHEMKENHEKAVFEAVEYGFAEVSFKELEQVTEWVKQVQVQVSGGQYILTEPVEKIRKNDLTEVSRNIIAMGLGVAREVQSYIQNIEKIDSEFPERLKHGFLEEYHRLKKKDSLATNSLKQCANFHNKVSKHKVKNRLASLSSYTCLKLVRSSSHDFADKAYS